MFYINNKRLLKKYKKNKKQTKKALYKIADSAAQADFNAKTAAENLQKVLRNYLEVRFDYPFTRTVTSDIMAGWQSVTGGLCSDKKEEAFGEIAEIGRVSPPPTRRYSASTRAVSSAMEARGLVT